MTEEIGTKLSKIEGIRIAPPAAAARLKSAQRDPKDIGQELGVQYLLQGSVRKAGDQVRISVQLVDASTGFQTWADDFVGDLKDVFSLQDQTALKIAQALNLKLTPQEQNAVRRRYTQNPQAYEAYLRGRALVDFIDQPKSLEAARTNYEKALQLDPNYAPALAGLSMVEVFTIATSIPAKLTCGRPGNWPSELWPSIRNWPRRTWPWPTFTETCSTMCMRQRKSREATALEPDNAHAWDQLSWALGYQQPPDSVGAEKLHGRRSVCNLACSKLTTTSAGP